MSPANAPSRDRVLVVGTTPDYVEALARDHPSRCLFLTDELLRAVAPENEPGSDVEIVADLSDPLSAERVLDEHLLRSRQRLVGLTCFDCESLPLAARLAVRYELTYPSPRAVARARNKHAATQRWREAGLPAPASMAVRSEAGAATFFHRVGAPIVLKPLSGSGSELVHLCRTEDECRAAFRAIHETLAAHPDARMYASLGDGAASVDPRTVAVAEEFIEGAGLSCDFVVAGGDIRLIRVCEKVVFPGEPLGTVNAYVIGGQMPAGVDGGALRRLLFQAAAVLGLDRALCVVDLVVRNGEVVLIELAPRPAGDCLPDLIRASSGFDVLGYALDFAGGAALPEIPAGARLVAVRLLAHGAGRIAHLDASRVRADPRVVSLRLDRRVGDRVEMPPHSCDLRSVGCALFAPDAGPPIDRQCAEIRAALELGVERLDGDDCSAAVDRCVEDAISGAPSFLEIARTHHSPLYVLEPDTLLRRARQFREAFEAALPEVRVYYALKSNNMDEVVRTLVTAGLGVDVSSGLELEQALAAGAADIMFSGPGKTDEELDLALSAVDRVVVLTDSFGELRRLRSMAASRNLSPRVGARISTADCGLWRKFGVPIERLAELVEVAAADGHLQFQGLQFHMSWLLDPSRQVAFIRRLGAALQQLPRARRSMIEFIDVGGGIWPEAGEWLHEDPALLPTGRLPLPRMLPSTSIEGFAAALEAALAEHVFPFVRCRVHLEPGRWLCHDAMHILITVIDKKADDIVIVDAGTNAIGWERFETDYFPIINLSRPSRDERPCTVYGSLCTPHDVWGFSYFGDSIEPGDVLLVPHQGAYTYSLRQQFIKPLPRVVVRSSRGSHAVRLTDGQMAGQGARYSG